MSPFKSFSRVAVLFCALASVAFIPAANAAEKKSFKIAWSIYVGWMPWDYAAKSGILKKWADKYGTKLYPETWFIDPDGVIRARIDGERDWTTGGVLDFAKSLQDKLSCGIQFRQGRPTGELAGLCGDFGEAG